VAPGKKETRRKRHFADKRGKDPSRGKGGQRKNKTGKGLTTKVKKSQQRDGGGDGAQPKTVWEFDPWQPKKTRPQRGVGGDEAQNFQ